MKIGKFPNSCINSLLCQFLQFSFTLIATNILLNTFLSKTASNLLIISEILLHMLPLVLLMSYWLLFILLWVLIDSLVEEEVYNMLYVHLFF